MDEPDKEIVKKTFEEYICDICREKFKSNKNYKKDEQKICPSCYF